MSTPPNPQHLPNGFRAGIISAITILIGFSLAFLRFWAFETPGEWTSRAVIVAVVLGIPIVLEIYVLYRSLRLEDEQEREYMKTVRWFMASIVAMLIAVIFAAVAPSGLL